MGTWRLVLFLFPLTVCSGITTNTQSSNSNTWNLLFGKSSLQTMYPTTSAVGNLFFIPSIAIRTDSESFPYIIVSPNGASKNESVASKIHMSESHTDKSNVNRNFTEFSNSSSLDLNNTTISVGNTGNTNGVVYIIVRVGIFFGGIFFILFAGIGMYKARTRCRPEKYDDPLKF